MSEWDAAMLRGSVADGHMPPPPLPPPPLSPPPTDMPMEDRSTTARTGPEEWRKDDRPAEDGAADGGPPPPPSLGQNAHTTHQSKVDAKLVPLQRGRGGGRRRNTRHCCRDMGPRALHVPHGRREQWVLCEVGNGHGRGVPLHRESGAPAVYLSRDVLGVPYRSPLPLGPPSAPPPPPPPLAPPCDDTGADRGRSRDEPEKTKVTMAPHAPRDAHTQRTHVETGYEQQYRTHAHAHKLL